MKIYFLRHGETDWNVKKIIQGHTDTMLTEKGLEQARQAKKVVDTLAIDVCYSSPLSRTMDTAKIVLGNRGVPIIPDQRLIELSAGDYTGVTYEEAAKMGIDFESGRLIDLPNGETAGEAYERIVNFFNELKMNSLDENILIVSHWRIAKFVKQYFEGLPKKGDEAHKIGNCEIVEYELSSDLLLQAF